MLFLPVSVFLLTPPFTQLNTPYPATAYLKGFFNTRNITSFQADLGIEVTLKLFSNNGLEAVFQEARRFTGTCTHNAERILAMESDYISTIDPVVRFLQGKDPTLAYQIVKRDLLPEASRFEQAKDLEWAFGTLGIQDHAKHLATLYLEDLADLIKETIDPHFGFSRYAEKLGRSASSFDGLEGALQKEFSLVDRFLINELEARIAQCQPRLVALSVPFPGNLFAALRCGQWIRKQHPQVKVVMGGGYPNTELRSLTDTRVFDYVDFITLDDGEAPLEALVEYIEGKAERSSLKRTLLAENGTVQYINDPARKDYRQEETGTPDYSDLPITKYISALEVANPMHRLWSDGRWNKLTMAHGCYWGKCTFCDITLDYIRLYEPVAAAMICDRIETLIAQTGETGFHFVDEAAPPALMRELALELLRRKIKISWWTNIRFEKAFSRDLCYLLKASGCIAVSGGLEVASDRLLKLIQKGITVEQVAKVNRNFTEAGIMVHAYLMYGFPTQTAQETIDSLEMVRQLFKAGVLQSAFWHLFTMTAHSPVGKAPEQYQVSCSNTTPGTFANNDLDHEDPTGADHSLFGEGLRKALFNYMHGIGIEEPLGKWFDHKVPRTTVTPDHIAGMLADTTLPPFKPEVRIVWIGNHSGINSFTQTKKGNSREMAEILIQHKRQETKISLPRKEGEWLYRLFTRISIHQGQALTLQEIRTSFETETGEDFELFWDNKPVSQLYKYGLLRL